MKYIKGYLWALVFGVITLGSTYLARRYGAVLDSFYPYVTRQAQAVLAWMSHALPFTLWQVAVYVLAAGLIVSIVLMALKKCNFFRWLGWVLCLASFLWMMHTCGYGLNFYASALSEDLRMESHPLTQKELEAATVFFRDNANALAAELPRDENQNLILDDFETLALQAGKGYENLKMAGKSVFAGSILPVKKLQWASLYSSMGICGVTMALTGEAAVNPQIPNMALPFVMCHEMAHRMCIAMENDANFAAFLACEANPDPQFRYAAFYMAYRYCYNELYKADTDALAAIHKETHELFRRDLRSYDQFFAREQNKVATTVANAANNAYIQASGDKTGIASYGKVTTQLINWYLETERQSEPQRPFDPLDKDIISDIVGGTK